MLEFGWSRWKLCSTVACTCKSCSEHVGTSIASAGRTPNGGAEQRQRRRGEDGPSQQKRALTKPDPAAVRFGRRALAL